MLLAELSDHSLERTGFCGFDAVMMQIKAQVALGWPVGAIKGASRKRHGAGKSPIVIIMTGVAVIISKRTRYGMPIKGLPI